MVVMAVLDWSQCAAVESVPGKVSGEWVLRGTRMPVATILANVEAGASIDEILQWFDGLNREQVKAVIDFAQASVEDARFRSAVQEGIAEAEQGDLIDEEEMDARVKRMLKR
jgi:uncharacterized protein (DUF433 family)